jgi:hypothetical protein
VCCKAVNDTAQAIQLLQRGMGEKLYVSLALRGILLMYSRMWFISDAISIQTRAAQPFKCGKIRQNSVCMRPTKFSTQNEGWIRICTIIWIILPVSFFMHRVQQNILIIGTNYKKGTS